MEIDRCLVCDGTCLDAGELELLTELAGVDPGELSRAVAETAKLRKADRRCPTCLRRLQVIEAGRETKVEIDRCPIGDGLWLDRGEMETVVRSFSEGVGGAVAGFFAELYRSDLGPQS